MTRLVKITGTKIEDVLNGSGLNEKIKGKGGADVINAGGGNDKIKGNDSNDLITGGGGNDSIDGGKGIDTAFYQGLYQQYAIAFSRSGDLQGTVTDLIANRDGADSLKKVEFLQFQNAVYDVENDTFFVLNNAPAVAHAIADQSVAEDSAVAFTFAANTFADADGDTLSYSATLDGGGALPGWLAFNAATRTFSGTPPLDFNGFLDVRVTASDGLASASDVFRLTVTPVNDAPVAQNDLASGNEDTEIVTGNVLLNDGDVDNALTNASVTLLTQAAHGSVAYNGNGTFTYRPLLNFNGPDSFTYTVSDGALTSQATVHVSVNPLNDAPTITVSPVTASVFETDPVQTITAALLLTASGASDVDGDVLKIVNPHLFGPDNVEVPLNALPPGVSVVFNGDGSFASLSFDPAGFSFLPANASASVRLEFDVSDGNGGTVHDAAIVTINGVNNPALIGNPNFHDVTEDSGVQPNGTLAASGAIPVSDPDDGESAFNTNTFTPANLGALTLQSNGAYTYSVQNGFTQFLGANDVRVDHFNIHSIDGTSRIVDFTIHGTNDPVLMQRLIANGSFEAIGTFVPQGGTFSPAGGSTVINNWTVTGAGIDYVRAGYQGSTPAQGGAFIDLSGSVAPLGVYAGGVSQTIVTQPGTRYLVQFAQSGNPDGPAVGGPVETIRVMAGAQSQDFAFDTTGHSWTSLGWVEREFTFTATGANTPLSFASLDGGGDFIGPLLDNVRVTAINSIVETQGTPQPATPDIALANNIAFSDADVSDHHTVGSVFVPGSDPQIGTFSAALLNDTTNGTGGLLHWDFHVGASAIEFLGANEHRLEMYRINVDDGHGGGANSTLFFDLVGTNDDPTFQGATNFTRSVQAPTGPVPIMFSDSIGFSDVDVHDHHVANPIFNSALSGAGAPLGQLFVTLVNDTSNGTGGLLQWNYVLDPSAINTLPVGTNRTDAFDVLLDDAHGGIATAHVTINIGGPSAPGGGGGGNQVPLTSPDTYFIGEAGTVQTVLSVAAPGVLANDFDTGPFTAELLSEPSHALFFSFDPDGSFTYLPQAFFGSYTTPGQQLVQSDSFQYRAFDGTSYSAPTTVTINVTPPPHVHGNTFAYDMQGAVDAAVQPMAKFYDDLALGNPVVTPGIPAPTVPIAPQNGFVVTTATETYLVRGEGFTYGPGNEPTGGTFNSIELLSATPGFPKISLFGTSTGVEPAWHVSASEFWQALQAYAGPGNDPAGLDTIFQAVRYDIIDNGQPVNSVITGGPFGDELRGAAGADVLYGSGGDDVLSGGASPGDVSTGGPGADRYEFGPGDGGNEVVTDFSGVVGGDHDVIDLRAFVGPGLSEVAHTFAQVLAHTHQDGLDTVIDYNGVFGIPDETLIRLQNFDIGDLRMEDFLYASSANLPPFAVSDATGGSKNSPIVVNVLGNDTDPEHDPLSVVGVERIPGDVPSASIVTSLGATVTVSGNQVIYDPTTSATFASFPPMPVTIGVDNFSYTITDGHGNFSTAAVTLSIMGI